GADINVLNGYGRLPIFYVQGRRRKYEIQKLLEEAAKKVKPEVISTKAASQPDLSFFSTAELKEMYKQAITEKDEQNISLIQKELAVRSAISNSAATTTASTTAAGQLRGSGDPLKGLNVARVTDMKVGKYYALLIGIDNYNGVWNQLNNAVNDARSIEDILKSKYKFDNFSTLYNEQATRSTIIKKMEWLVENVKDEDNVFIYYSGHGDFKENLNKGYWVPFDATTKSTAEYISNNDIQTYLGGIRSKHTLLVSDACFSGDLFRGQTISVPFEDSEKYYKKIHALSSRKAITSGGLEPVMDGGRDGHSVFAYYFLKNLRNNENKYYDATELYNDIKIPVTNNSDQSPRFQPIKNTGDEGGQFVFIIKDSPPTEIAINNNAEIERLNAEAKMIEEARLKATAQAKAEEEAHQKAATQAKAEEEARLKAAAQAKAEEEARLKAAAQAKAEEEARLKAAAQAKAVEEEARKREAAEAARKTEAKAAELEQLKSEVERLKNDVKESNLLELNSATKKDFKEIEGLDGVFSERIAKYRDLLGGFTKKEQLMEVSGIDGSLFKRINSQIRIDKRRVRKININTCSNFQLLKHPYISSNVADAIISYRNQHGKYTSVSDIKNVTLMNEALYVKIAPYLSEKDENILVESKSAKEADKRVAPLVLELNSTNKTELKKLEGIGAGLSDKVIKFRDLLGGFVSKEQLTEVDGFNNSLVNKLADNLEVDLLKVRKINLNACSSYQLAKHPYLTLDNANAIIGHREKKGNYASVADIKREGLVSDAVYLKIMPYLTAP
ncbi:MAG TPA: hypothetical protein EYN69_00940, partial [Flavobacteriales bacterium]|nr:hypothetical protein [Flavobacteriales bacterium]